MFEIRPATPADMPAISAISLATGDSGKDASALYENPAILSEIYALPYVVINGGTGFVLEDEEGVAGYVVGAYNTVEFDEALEADWWPKLREKYQRPDPGRRDIWTADERRAEMIHHPKATPQELVSNYPAHMHLNLLTRAQGQGGGRRLCAHWLETARNAGVTAVHVGANPGNKGGIAFWERMGFVKLDLSTKSVVWLGRSPA